MFKAAFAILRLLSFFAGQVERWQLKKGVVAEAKNAEITEILKAVQEDKERAALLRGLLHSDPAVRDRLRRHYQRVGVLPS